MFLDYQKILSYGAFLNFLLAERGVGKTYGALKFCINDYINKDNQFIYLRRYKTELPKNSDELFSRISENQEFGENVLSLKAGRNRSELKFNGDTMGYAIPLSTSLILKSIDFSRVKNIIFDEFIIEKSSYHYLQNEVFHFLEFIETVGRLRDIRVFLLGNAIQKANPYFNYFHLDIPYESEYKTFKNGLILVNYSKNEAYREEKRRSKFGQLTAGTEYGNYAIENKFLHENQTFIEKRPPHAKFYFIIRADGKSFGVWTDHSTGKIYLSTSYDPKCPIVYACTVNDHNENTHLVRVKSSTFMATLIERYRNGLLCFENQVVKQHLIPLFNKYVN